MAKRIIIENVELGNSGEISKDKLNTNFKKVDDALEILDFETVKNTRITPKLGNSTNHIPSEYAVYTALKELDTHKKGYFSTIDLLLSAYPTAEKGDYAYVGENGQIMEWNGTTWVSTGKNIPVESPINLNDYQKIAHREWLKNKNHPYKIPELGAISRIFDITIYDGNITATDVYSVNEFYVDKDTNKGVINIFKNGVSYTRQSAIDISKQRFTNEKIDVFFDLTIPVTSNWDLNTLDCNVIIAPHRIVVPYKIQPIDKAIIGTRKWLRDKTSEVYDKYEVDAIKRLLDIKIYLDEINPNDVYTVNIMRFLTEDKKTGQLGLYKNGFIYPSLSGINLDVAAKKRVSPGRIEVEYDFALGLLDKNVTTSSIVIDNSCIFLVSDYLKGLTYEMTKMVVNNYGVTTQADVIWSDGIAGVYKVTDFNSKFSCYDGYTITHSNTGKILKQPKVTRNNLGVIIEKPQLIVTNP